jgi:hypothetical protein
MFSLSCFITERQHKARRLFAVALNAVVGSQFNNLTPTF